jgi:hypothetical protein
VLVSIASVYLAGVSTYRIFQKTLFPEVVATQHSCRSGTQALYEAIAGARLQAAKSTQPERVALRAFRKQLDPIWRQAPAVRVRCQEDRDQEALEAFRMVELLRYAEERAVRYNAIDLTKWRVRAPELVGALNGPEKKNIP